VAEGGRSSLPLNRGNFRGRKKDATGLLLSVGEESGITSRKERRFWGERSLQMGCAGGMRPAREGGIIFL